MPSDILDWRKPVNSSRIVGQSLDIHPEGPPIKGFIIIKKPIITMAKPPFIKKVLPSSVIFVTKKDILGRNAANVCENRNPEQVGPKKIG